MKNKVSVVIYSILVIVVSILTWTGSIKSIECSDMSVVYQLLMPIIGVVKVLTSDFWFCSLSYNEIVMMLTAQITIFAGLSIHAVLRIVKENKNEVENAIYNSQTSNISNSSIERNGVKFAAIKLDGYSKIKLEYLLHPKELTNKSLKYSDETHEFECKVLSYAVDKESMLLYLNTNIGQLEFNICNDGATFELYFSDNTYITGMDIENLYLENTYTTEV